MKKQHNAAAVDADILYETRPHQFVTEASAIGWKPGTWPQRFVAEPRLGNGQLFWIHKQLPNEGGYIYQQELGCVRVTVFND